MAVPLKNIAQRLGLPLHEITTFTGWQPPVKDGVQVNLIMAVSFGLLVPPRILSYAQYGGLNLHPSLLPEYVATHALLMVELQSTVDS